MKTKTIRQVIRNKINEWLDSIEDQELKNYLSTKIVVTGGCIASMLLKEKVSDFDVYLRDRESCIKIANYYVERFKPKTSKGIPCKIHVDTTKQDRVSVVIKSAGIASENGTEKEYEYFETFGENETDRGTSYVSSVMNDPGDIQDTYEETEQAALEVDTGPKYRPVFISTNAVTLSNKIQIITRFYGEPEQIHENYDFVHCTNYWKSWGSESESLVLKKKLWKLCLQKNYNM